MNNKSWFVSSTGEGIALRIKSLAALLIPVLNQLLSGLGVNVIPDQFDLFVDAVFVVVFVVLHVIGWARRNVMKGLGEGKFSDKQ